MHAGQVQQSEGISAATVNSQNCQVNLPTPLGRLVVDALDRLAVFLDRHADGQHFNVTP